MLNDVTHLNTVSQKADHPFESSTGHAEKNINIAFTKPV